MNVVVGKTTKSDVLEVFGAPNVTTRNGEGNEIWTYQRQAQIQESSQNNSFGTLLIFGGGSSTAGFKNSSRMITLIIKFDSNDVVIDYSSRESNF
ncbi:hypothetical protein [Maribrevibacterium harenarium]|nr:hypothetical protein [Maribrevibacterium harenarium]